MIVVSRQVAEQVIAEHPTEEGDLQAVVSAGFDLCAGEERQGVGLLASGWMEIASPLIWLDYGKMPRSKRQQLIHEIIAAQGLLDKLFRGNGMGQGKNRGETHASGGEEMEHEVHLHHVGWRNIYGVRFYIGPHLR